MKIYKIYKIYKAKVRKYINNLESTKYKEYDHIQSKNAVVVVYTFI